MQSYSLGLQFGGTKRLHGQVVLAPGRIYFICTAKSSGLVAALGQAIGGLAGGLIAATTARSTGQAFEVDEVELQRLVADNPGSLVLEATDIFMIKDTKFTRLIKWRHYPRIGLFQGLSPQLKAALGHWAECHGVQTKGFR